MKLKMIERCLAVAVVSLSVTLPAQARTFGCVDIAAPAQEGDYANTPTRGTRVAFDEIDVHPMQLWEINHHVADLYNNTGSILGSYYMPYYRGWGPGESTIYVRWWVLPAMTYTHHAQTQSQYPTGYWVPDYQWVNCFVPVPF